MKGSPKTIGSATPLMAAVIELNNQVPPDRLAYYSYFDQHPDWAAESWSGMITEADLQLDGSYLVTLKVVPHLARPIPRPIPFPSTLSSTWRTVSRQFTQDFWMPMELRAKIPAIRSSDIRVLGVDTIRSLILEWDENRVRRGCRIRQS